MDKAEIAMHLTAKAMEIEIIRSSHVTDKPFIEENADNICDLFNAIYKKLEVD